MATAASSRTVVAVCGCGHEGRLGLGTPTTLNEVQSISAITPIPFFLRSTQAEGKAGNSSLNGDNDDVGTVLSIHCGAYHTIARTTTGLYGWGANDCGQLGLGKSSSSGAIFHSPTRLTFFDQLRRQEKTRAVTVGDDDEVVMEVSCGGGHSLVRTTRALYATGANEYGQLGLGHSAEVFTWERVCTLPVMAWGLDDGDAGSGVPLLQGNITHISCGTHHTLVAWCDAFLLVSEKFGENEDARGTEAGKKRLRYYPALVTACGKGDYGELGYDAEVWQVHRSRDQRVHASLVGAAQRRQMAGTALSAGSHPSDEGEMGGGEPYEVLCGTRSNPYAAKWKAKQKERRPEFYSAVLRPALVAALEEAAISLNKSVDVAHLVGRECVALAAAAPCAMGGDQELMKETTKTPPWQVDELRAMHMHSAVTLQRRHDSNSSSAAGAAAAAAVVRVTLHWGCFYCNEVEDNTSSIPRPIATVEATAKEDAPPHADIRAHAGNEMLVRYYTHKAADQTAAHEPPFIAQVMGSGVLGLGDDDSFEKDWVLLPLSVDDVANTSVVSVVGRDHCLLALTASHHLGAVVATVFGFGDNLHGQLGVSNGEDSVTAPVSVLKVGDVLNEEWVVEAIRDVGAGARHSVFLIDVHHKE